MSQSLPVIQTSRQRVGSCIGEVIHTDTDRDVGFCILWNDGNYEICLDSNTLLHNLSTLFIRPRPQYRFHGECAARLVRNPTPRCVGELHDQGALVSVLEQE